MKQTNGTVFSAQERERLEATLADTEKVCRTLAYENARLQREASQSFTDYHNGTPGRVGGVHPPEHYERYNDHDDERVDIAANVVAAADAMRSVDDPKPGYEALAAVLRDAMAQATSGKGHERHARGNPFHEQHMQSISRLLGTERGMAFQVIKKLTEGLDLPTHEARERELLGAINYLAGIVVYYRLNEEGPARD
jgi:hypothetical protein